jgi:hypothetical protein
VKAELNLDEAWGLYDRQVRFARDHHLFSLFLGGVGSGKSVALTAKAIVLALENPGAEGGLFGRTGRDLDTVLLPSLFDQLQAAQDQSGVSLIRDHDKGNAKLRLINGASIYFRPYNRIAKVRGLTLTWGLFDEVEWSEANPDEVWSTATGRLRGRGPVPCLGFATSPNGLRGITKKFVDAQRNYLDAKNRGDVAGMAMWGQYYVVTATSFANPYLPDHFFDSLRAMGKRRYEQEVNGKVLCPQNVVLDLQARQFVPWDWREHLELPRVYGVDWGTQNHHVAIMAQVLPSGRWVVCDELVCDDMPRGQFEAKLYEWVDRHSAKAPAAFGCDRACPSENNHLALRYRHSRVAWMESVDEKRVETGLEMLRDAFDPLDGEPLIVFSDRLSLTFTGVTAPIVPALRGYVYILDQDGIPTRRPRKDNIHDHAVDALRYVWHGTSERQDLHGGRTLWTSMHTPTAAQGASPRNANQGH